MPCQIDLENSPESRFALRRGKLSLLAFFFVLFFCVAINAAGQGQIDLWSSTTTPGTVDRGDGNAVELGVKFTSDLAGYITGIRFYKSAANTGTHIGNLWTSSGTLLASAIFTNESASGWQQVSFSSPVAISANTIYVASYYAPQGHYSDNVGFFASAGVDNPPLHALANTVSPNGVYLYSSTSTFPSSTASASNYWVDVVYFSTITGSVPTVVSMSPANGATSVSAGTDVTATFNEPMNASTLNSSTFQLTVPQAGGGSIPVPATVSYNSSTLTATLVPSQPLAYSTTYTAVVEGGTNGVQDSNGNQLPSSVSWSFTTAAPPATCPCSIWSSTATPGTVDNGDGNAVELGVKFTSDLGGFITGIRFYKSAANTGTHIGNLWTSSGTLLGSAVFTMESASGWQQVSFSSPVAISANTTYVASYYAPQGHYSDNVGFFASAGVDNPPLHALANTVSPNGVYMYSSTSLFPSSTASASNYWVDVVYSSTTTGLGPTIISVSPANGATSASVRDERHRHVQRVDERFDHQLQCLPVNGSPSWRRKHPGARYGELQQLHAHCHPCTLATLGLLHALYCRGGRGDQRSSGSQRQLTAVER